MGTNYNDLPAWQKRGMGIYYKNISKDGYNPITDERVIVEQSGLFVDYELPYGDEYRNFILSLITGQ